jgi:hypothetical protein
MKGGLPVTTILDLIGVLLVAAGLGLLAAIIVGIWCGLLVGGLLLLFSSWASDVLTSRGGKK